ncbi:lipoxygenase family protein [Enterovibrio nigricans]|uniref:Lipoxygenase n=1 Tax=Enterovibrio nigricans DSM 22720 TaxID=1121868 RepID=A0A1T4W935_9GAMM|nr:lipoxygenase family protein [Enterovibrio nigricans]SKA73707.1 Lipoxygenase [Enterovibrio nigricans DSM 22720]
MPQHDDDADNSRKDALDLARKIHRFNYTEFPGAVIHGNVGCQEIQDASAWQYRGTIYELEDNFGVNDHDSDFSGVRLFEATLAYWDKHIDAVIEYYQDPVGQYAAEAFSIALSNRFDGDGHIEVDVMDAVLWLLPPRKCNTVDELDFYPTFCSDHPEYGQRVKQWVKPAYDDDFRNDDLIGWLMTASPTPLFNYFKPYTEHMAKFPVTNYHFNRVAGFENDDLDQAMAEGRLFYTDFEFFHDQSVAWTTLENVGGRLFAGIALFAVPSNGKGLKTVAIQPTQDHLGHGIFDPAYWSFLGWAGYGANPRPPSKIITPADNYWAWQMAKNSITTMTSMAGVVDHLSTHIYLGPIPVAYFRNITEKHPLRALLDTHLMALVTNNHAGVFFYTPEAKEPDDQSPTDYPSPFHGLLTGAIQKLSGFSSVSFATATINKKNTYDFFEHSTPFDRHSDPAYSQLESYPQHDDNEMFPIIHDWVNSYIRLYYESNEDVINDKELQNFLWETRYRGEVAGFPEKADSVTELVDIVTRIIYWMSVNHAFTGFASFMKLGALGFYGDKPIEPTWGYTEKDWLNICPPMNTGAGLFFFSRLFTDLPEDWHRSLGKYPKGQFRHDSDVYPHLVRFQSRLRALDQDLRDKYASSDWKFGMYDLRMPSTITVSPWN